jgi:aryl-phospho-beta-D-glucosidase BglC (GH1 family)
LLRLSRLIIVTCLAALALPLSAQAASRMYVGFQDDQSFRFAPDRQTLFDQAQKAGATVIRITVEWAAVAPTAPANASNPFDPTYRLDDVDEAVRNAQSRGIEVLMSIWGTPGWANGNAGENHMPRNLNTLKGFAKALSARYSGRYPGYPHVRFWSVWNESNLDQFLAPQFDSRGRSVGPANYAKLYQAAYSGIKAGNKDAKVAIGETSPRGRDKPSPGAAQDSHSPGKFAELVAKANKRLKFDAWAHHPYSTETRLSPAQKVKWPNVTLPSMPRFEQSLDQWFVRKNIPIWITEYGYQTKPPRSSGVSLPVQSSYLSKAFQVAKNDPRVQLFVWFIFRDSKASGGSPWQAAGGLLDANGGAKPSLGRFTVVAPAVDARDAQITVKPGTSNPHVSFPALELAARNPMGSTVGLNYRIFDGTRLLGNAVGTAQVGKDGWLGFTPALTVSGRSTYKLEITATDVNGNSVKRAITLKAA